MNICKMFIILLAITSEMAQGLSLCDRYGKVYNEQIAIKIKDGIPFELMSIVSKNKSILCKKVVRIKYDLWDEIVTIEDNGVKLASFPFKDTEKILCRFLEVPSSCVKEKCLFQLLLNPMWAGRIARLKSAQSADSQSPSKFLKIDWDRFLSVMPSDKILLQIEVTP